MRAVAEHRSATKEHLCKFVVALGILTVVAIPLHSQTLHGQVVDSVSAEPLVGIELFVLDAQQDTVAVARSGPDGRFTINVPAGAYTLCCRCIGLRPKQVPVEVPSENIVIVSLAPISIPPGP